MKRKTKSILTIIIVLLFSTTVLAQKPTIEWINVPTGTFQMGRPLDESFLFTKHDAPFHSVTISAFKMSKYEITFDEYDLFCDDTGHKKPKDNGWGRGKRPVINVSWIDAKEFAEWLGCRLPTEAEWEYACRAGTTTPFNTGKDLCSNQANYNFNALTSLPTNCSGYEKKSTQTDLVGSYPSNAWGLHDMHGNVFEWCNDWFGEYQTEAQINPQGPSSGLLRVARGGGWRYPALYCWSGLRFKYDPTSKSANIGLMKCSIGIRLVSSE